MFKGMKKYLSEELKAIDEAGLYKRERIIITPQTADIKISSGQEVINFCANNYLGLSDHPRLIQAAKAAMDSHGFGRIRSSMQPASMPMVVSSSLYLAQRMPSSAML